jgi:hypothetical protein
MQRRFTKASWPDRQLTVHTIGLLCVKRVNEGMADTCGWESMRLSSSFTPARLHPHVNLKHIRTDESTVPGKCGTIRSAAPTDLNMNHTVGSVDSNTTAQYGL